MTACMKLVRALDNARPHPLAHCGPCVYFSKNIDRAQFPALQDEACGLGFAPHDAGCMEMRTDNCSARKG